MVSVTKRKEVDVPFNTRSRKVVGEMDGGSLQSNCS